MGWPVLVPIVVAVVGASGVLGNEAIKRRAALELERRSEKRQSLRNLADRLVFLLKWLSTIRPGEDLPTEAVAALLEARVAARQAAEQLGDGALRSHVIKVIQLYEDAGGVGVESRPATSLTVVEARTGELLDELWQILHQPG